MALLVAKQSLKSRILGEQGKERFEKCESNIYICSWGEEGYVYVVGGYCGLDNYAESVTSNW